MRFRFEQTNEKEEVVVYGKEKTDLAIAIEKLCFEHGAKLIGYYDNNRFKEITVDDVDCFITLGKNVVAICNNETLKVKYKLYELYEQYNSHLVYINQGCLANVSKIKQFDSSIGAALLVYFKSGYKDYVSRRQIKNVKERLGLK